MQSKVLRATAPSIPPVKRPPCFRHSHIEGSVRQRTQGGVGWEGRWRPSPFEAADCPCKSPRLPKLLESWCNHRDHLGTRAQPPFIVLEPQSNPRNDLGDLGVHFGDATKGWKEELRARVCVWGWEGRFLAATQLGLGT